MNKVFKDCKIKLLPECTWLRMMSKNESTDIHADYSYFKQATNIFSTNIRGMTTTKQKDNICALCDKIITFKDKLDPKQGDGYGNDGEQHCITCCNKPFSFYTCWIPLQNLKPENSVLCILPKTHQLKGYEKPLGQRGLVPSEFNIKNHQFHIPTNIEIGDMIIFNIKTIHAATLNLQNFFRLSMDTRVYISNSN